MIVKMVSAPIIKVVTLLLTLLSIYFTEKVLSPEEFVSYNSALFFLTIVAALSYPLNIGLWAPSYDRRPSLSITWLFAALLSSIFAVMRGTFAGVALFFYMIFRSYERFVSVLKLTRKSFYFAYFSASTWQIFELLSVTILMFIFENHTHRELEWRLLIPCVFASAFCILYITCVKDRDIAEVGRRLLSIHSLDVIPYIHESKRTIYMLTFTFMTSSERLLIENINVDNEIKAGYLLAFSLGTAFLGLLVSINEWARPYILDNNKSVKGGGGLIYFSACTIMLLFYMLSIYPGLSLLQAAHLLPSDTCMKFWISQQTIFLVYAFLSLFSIQDVYNNKVLGWVMTFILIICLKMFFWSTYGADMIFTTCLIAITVVVVLGVKLSTIYIEQFKTIGSGNG